MVNDIRRNHALEADLKKLDKRIALLIKNRGNLQMVLAAQQGLKSQKKKKQVTAGENETIISDPKRLEHYQNLFYLLQTEPRYLARLVFLMKSKDMENFLDTVLLTLYGDAFSPREEFLILELFKHALNFEMKGVKDVRDFLQRRLGRAAHGVDLQPPQAGPAVPAVRCSARCSTTSSPTPELDLELKPLTVYNKIIADYMVQTGEQWAGGEADRRGGDLRAQGRADDHQGARQEAHRHRRRVLQRRSPAVWRTCRTASAGSAACCTTSPRRTSRTPSRTTS
jgi:Ras GTPase-activating-like protein IQGAP2/3